ncbi:MAG: SsrA-binding protein [Parcubacteria group bacterium GW2011_GWF2_38_76]|nr:MAG: SsrA-binding protein [Parcubacteria group bacterium GW2011_GWF2_38_76]HBM45366.1 SsrA-binding protein [Patescibacteria group bacterium]
MSLIVNKKYGLKYEIIEKISAGIELLGTEVKTIKAGHGVIDAAYIIIRGGEAYLINADIRAHQPKNAEKDFEPTRTRKLLLTKKELDHLAGASSQRGLTLIPISFYTKGKKIKVDIAIARGKKKFDKRETIKKREVNKNIERIIKEGR